MTEKIDIPTVKLNNDLEYPAIGLGTGGHISDRDILLMEDAVYEAITCGYRHIDTAWLYKTEPQVGRAVKRAIDDGIIKRNDLFIVTKVWIDHLKPEMVKESIKESLENLGMDYVDCLLIHWPTPTKTAEDGKFSGELDTELDIFTETWPVFEELLEKGLTKSIGVSNFNCSQIKKLAEVAKVLPVTNQVECTPFLPQTKLLETCKEIGIVLTSYGPFGGHDPSLQKDDEKDEVRTSLLEHPTVLKLAEKHNKSVGQILLRFHVDRGVVPIPKSVSKERIVQNADIFDFKLSEEDIKELEGLENGTRRYGAKELKEHPNYPFNEK